MSERLARRRKKSPSRLRSEAVAEYVAQHGADAVTAKLNDVWGREAAGADPFVAAAARRLLERTDR